MEKPSVDPTIFLLNDIRGLYPRQLNEDSVYQIGRAYIEFLKRGTKKKTSFRIAIARDVRPSSKRLFQALSRAIRDQGANVYDIGLVTTPMMYFSVIRYKLDGGIMITASHNPNPFNGLKMVGPKASPISEDSGLMEVKRTSLKSIPYPKTKKGWLKSKKVTQDYISDVHTFYRGSRNRPSRAFTIAIDTGNGLVGPFIQKFFKGLNIKVVPLYFRPDGNFPNHIPDPLILHNLNDLIKLIKKRKVDFGLAFDGDGDRMLVVDNKGTTIPGDLMTAFIAKELLKNHRKERIIYDVRSSNVVKEVIKEAGGAPIQYRIGHSLIKKRMRRGNILFGGELSGHYYVRKYHYIESPLFILFTLLKILEREKKPLHELIQPLRKYFHSGEINFEVPDRCGKIKEVEQQFKGKGGKISHLDGLRIDFKDWWFNLRPSGTEPLVRLVVEAHTKKILKAKKEMLINAIGRKYLIDIEAYKKKQIENT